MNLFGTFIIYGGGSGSGCQGPNCGRPSGSGKSTSTNKEVISRKLTKIQEVVQKYTKKYDLKQLYPSDNKLTRWEDCIEDHGKGCDPKILGTAGPMVAMYQELGIKVRDVSSVQSKIDSWVQEPSNSFANLSQKVVTGKISTPIAKALAVESMLAQEAIKGDTVTLYRGVAGKYAVNALNSALKSDNQVIVKSKGADSWTDKESVAKKFGGLVISSKVPAKYVITSYKSNERFFFHEHEFIVAFPKGKIPISRTGLSVSPDVDLDSASSGTIEVDLTDDANFKWLRNNRTSDEASEKIFGVGLGV